MTLTAANQPESFPLEHGQHRHSRVFKHARDYCRYGIMDHIPGTYSSDAPTR